MDDRLKEASAYYDGVVRETSNLAVTVGRGEDDLEKSEFIWQDIKSKLRFERAGRVLDIGCGYGEVTKLLLRHATDLELKVQLVDVPGVIDAIAENFSALLPPDAKLVPGLFPHDFADLIASGETFDYIIVYSVVHCSDEPRRIVDAAAKLLAPGGKLLVGDLPNIDKKGRFLSTEFGRRFEADYRGLPVDEVPSYSDYRDYVSRGLRQEENRVICDEFVFKLLEDYRSQGFDAFVLDQDERLPFSFTREDLLLIRGL